MTREEQVRALYTIFMDIAVNSYDGNVLKMLRLIPRGTLCIKITKQIKESGMRLLGNHDSFEDEVLLVRKALLSAAMSATNAVVNDGLVEYRYLESAEPLEIACGLVDALNELGSDIDIEPPKTEELAETELAEEITDIYVALQELGPSSASTSETDPYIMGDFIVAVVKMVIAVALMALIFSGHCQ